MSSSVSTHTKDPSDRSLKITWFAVIKIQLAARNDETQTCAKDSLSVKQLVFALGVSQQHIADAMHQGASLLSLGIVS